MQPKELQPKQLGLVFFDSDPHGANIYVDGQVLVDQDSGENLRTPARANLYEGRHDFSMTLEGHEDADGYFDVFPGVSVNIYRSLKPGKSEEGWGKPQPQIWLGQQKEVPKQITEQNKLSSNEQQQKQQQIQKLRQGTGIIKAYSFPDGAEVYIDGRPAIDSTGKVVKTPATIYNVPAGARRVSFRMPGQLEETKLVDVEEGSWSDVTVTMRPTLPKLGKFDSYKYGFLDVEDFPDEDGKMFKML